MRNFFNLKMLPWLLLSFLILFLDQATKHWALQTLSTSEAKVIFPGFALTLAYNTGAAFSFLGNASGWQTGLFTVFAFTLSGVLIVWLLRLPCSRTLVAFAIAFIVGGALGNLYDRLTLGYVVDFILLYYKHWAWPVFNVADSAICIGAGLLFIDTLRS